MSAFSMEIKVEPYGTLEFMGLVLKDMAWLDDAQIKALPAREFTVQLLQTHLVSPVLDMETVRAWSDDLLASVATYWWRDQQLQQQTPSQSLLSFEEFKQAVYAYNDQTLKQNQETVDAFLRSYQQFNSAIMKTITPFNGFMSQLASFGHLTKALNSQFAVFTQASDSIRQLTRYITGLEFLYEKVFASTQLISSALNSILHVPQLQITAAMLNVQQFYDSLPNFADMERLWKESQEAGQAFDQAGYGFTMHLVSYRSIRGFASIHPQVRNAVITNTMVAQTRKKEFEEQLHRLFQKSTVQRRRWGIVAQALDAHRRRDYYISVPALLAQIEGIIADLLIWKNLIFRVGNKLYLKEVNGTFKLDKNGRRIEARGLVTLITHSKWQQHTVLQGVADLIDPYLAKERNEILHGRRVDYGTAKLSVQGLLILLVLASEFAAFETGQV